MWEYRAQSQKVEVGDGYEKPRGLELMVRPPHGSGSPCLSMSLLLKHTHTHTCLSMSLWLEDTYTHPAWGKAYA